jgi:hypothetical protein
MNSILLYRRQLNERLLSIIGRLCRQNTPCFLPNMSGKAGERIVVILFAKSLAPLPAGSQRHLVSKY